jgi:hypothetical protein
MHEPPSFVDVDINQLAHFVFVRNVDDAVVEVSLEGLSTSKDLFYFCLDLFCKGLVLMFGDANDQVNLASLSLEDFQKLQKRMLLAGIKVHLNVEETNSSQPKVDIGEIELMPENLNISEYVFKVQMPSMMYKVSFEMVHSII